MKKIASTTRQNCSRWIFIFGVLIGLFFSGGEGIQLLPFPISEGNNSKNTSSGLEKNFKSYALSIHNSGNQATSFASKIQKHTNQYLSGKHLTFDWSNVRANSWLPPTHNREKANLPYLSFVLNSQSDRAPPTV